jgi:hypothetical protein
MIQKQLLSFAWDLKYCIEINTSEKQWLACEGMAGSKGGH